LLVRRLLLSCGKRKGGFVFIFNTKKRSLSLGLHFHSVFACLAAVPAGALAMYLSRVDISNPQLCGVAFKRNIWVGPLLLMGIGLRKKKKKDWLMLWIFFFFFFFFSFFFFAGLNSWSEMAFKSIASLMFV
jgi:hypothetical protein